MSLRVQSSAVLFVSLLVFAGCKMRGSESALNEYEKPEYAGKDICSLVKDEASRQVKERRNTFPDAYKEIFNREAAIFSLLVPKARLCVANRSPVERKPASAPPPDASAGSDSANGLEVAAPVEISPAQDPECEGLTDPARLATFEEKLAALKTCDPMTTTIIDPNATAGIETLTQTALDPGLDQTAEERQLEDASGLALTDEALVNSDICSVIGLDSSACKSIVAGGVGLTGAQLNSMCRAAGAFLKEQKLGKYDSEAARECGAEIVQDICLRNVLIGQSVAYAQNDGSKKLAQKVQATVSESTKQVAKGFTVSIMKCAAAYGKEKAKQLVVSAASDVVKSAFSQRLDKAEAFLANAKTKVVASALCAVGAGIANATMGKYEAKDINAECKDLWTANKPRAQACVATVKELGCDAIVAGQINLSESLHINDDNQLGKLFADATSGVLEGACRVAGANVGSAACSAIAKSGGYIIDALRGKSNPWADCLGTPAMGACVADYWHKWSTGVEVEDYKVGIAESKKKEDTKYYNDVCWCWRKCMSNDWGTDREVHKDLYWEMATKGDAGTRFCASKERQLKWPTNFTWENGRRTLYIQYTSCGVSPARGPDTNLWDDKGFMEIFVDGKWGWYKFPRNDAEHYMGCGGLADGGI